MADEPTEGRARLVTNAAQFAEKQPLTPPTLNSSRKRALAPFVRIEVPRPTRSTTRLFATKAVIVCTIAETTTVTPAAFAVAVPDSARETVLHDEVEDDGTDALDCARRGLLANDGPS